MFYFKSTHIITKWFIQLNKKHKIVYKQAQDQR
jgi:hypothetical protein